MRDKIEWAKKHRNGMRRANAIIDRQDNKPLRDACVNFSQAI